MKTAAFFDIDGTLYRDSLMIEHFKKLVKYEVIDAAAWHSHVKHTHADWVKRVGEYDDYMLELAEIYIRSLTGLNLSRLAFIADQVISLKGDMVYSFTRDRIFWHKSKGHKVIFISGSPDFLVSKMAAKYGVEDYKATHYELDENGNFTGRITPMWDAQSKDRAIKEMVDAYHIDLSKSFAYGDTNGDLSMLKIVGHPTAINPTKELLDNIRNDSALAHHAKIIVERKDIIYELSSSVRTVQPFRPDSLEASATIKEE